MTKEAREEPLADLKYGDRGPRVKALQRLLNDNWAFKLQRKLVVDGEFGTLTAAAVQKAKYWLGYQQENNLPVAGEILMGLLDESHPLKSEMEARRKKRLAPKPQSPADALRLKALDIIRGELGTLEKPVNSDHIKYNEWWGWGRVAYCVIGVSWSWVKAGSKAFVKGARWANTDAMLSDAMNNRHDLHLTNNPKPGCPGVIDWEGHSNPDHAITFVKDNGDGTARTIEFNARKDGVGGVWNQTRPLRQCWWFSVER